MTPGYHGFALKVDLTTRTWQRVPLPEELLRQTIGGAGLGTALLLEATPGAPGALSPEAPVVIAFSPLVGSPLTTSAKFAIVAQSPLTRRINDSLSSSYFAIAGKRTGHDALIITGAAADWTTLVIEPDAVRFLPAGSLLGQSARATGELVRQQLGPAHRVAAIGVAGERQVAYATVSHDGRHAGRGGLGAVFGSKRLKAVAVTGDRLTTPHDPDAVISYSRELSALSFGPATAKYREIGTVANLLTFNRLGALPTRNFQQTTFADAALLAPETLQQQFPRSRASCAACTIGCEHLYRPESGSPVRMEYENLFALGPLCGVSDPEAVLRASSLCDEWGLDTISAGVSIAFAMECVERGLWPTEFTRGPEAIAPRFGSSGDLLKLIEQIATRRGAGDLLSQGVRAAAARIGPDSEPFAMHVKGLELPGYEPRTLQTMALGFAVGTRGADHNRSGAYQVDFSERTNRLAPDEAAVCFAIETENEAAAMDSLILCKFLRGVFTDRFAAMATMLRLITGWELDGPALMKIAAGIVDLKKRYNIRQGWTPAEDWLPERCFNDTVPDGPGAGTVLSRDRLRAQIREYNRQRGWTDDGWFAENPRPPGE